MFCCPGAWLLPIVIISSRGIILLSPPSFCIIIMTFEEEIKVYLCETQFYLPHHHHHGGVSAGRHVGLAPLLLLAPVSLVIAGLGSLGAIIRQGGADHGEEDEGGHREDRLHLNRDGQALKGESR